MSNGKNSGVIIHRIVEGVHMGLGHVGLAKVLRKQLQINVDNLAQGELVLCLNRQGDKMKVIGHRGLVLGYLRMPGGQRIMKEALQYIPQTFGSGGFNYDAAVRKRLEKRFESYPAPRVSPLKAAQAERNAGLN